MDKRLITERLIAIATASATELGTELVHVEIAGTKRDAVLRVYIDKEGGVTLDDCGAVSKKIEEVLEIEDLIPSRYVLEVSSPGIERQLYSLADFVKFTGHLAKVKTKNEIGGQKTFVGPITGIDGEKIVVEDRTAGTVRFEYADVDKANLKIDLAKEFGGR